MTIQDLLNMLISQINGQSGGSTGQSVGAPATAASVAPSNPFGVGVGLPQVNQGGAAGLSALNPSASSSSSSPLGELGGLGNIGSSITGLITAAEGNNLGSTRGAFQDTLSELPINSALAGSSFGPWGTLAGAALGDITNTIGDFNSGREGEGAGRIIGTLLGSPILGSFLGDLIAPAGVPRGAKTAAEGQALSASGNPLDQLIGKFVTNGAGAGRVLSESGPNTFGQSTEDIASFLSALTGQQEANARGTGTNFTKPANFIAPGLGRAGTNFQIPAGYNFLDPSLAPDAAKIIQQIVGIQSPAGSFKAADADWQKVLQQLISKGDLTRFQGTLGSPNGGTPTAATGTASAPGAVAGSSNPTVSLPHPLAQPQVVQPPYPLTAGA